jgi:hypothetical protein
MGKEYPGTTRWWRLEHRGGGARTTHGPGRGAARRIIRKVRREETVTEEGIRELTVWGRE